MSDETFYGYAVHPACELLPMMSEASLAELAEDIKTNGQEQAVVVHRGLLLDGRNRLKACAIAGVTPKIREWEGEDPVRWVLSLNFHRRHLTDSQKSIVGAHAAELLAERVTQRAEEQENAERASDEHASDEQAKEGQGTAEQVSDEPADAEHADAEHGDAELAAEATETPSKPDTAPKPAPKKLSQREIRRQARESAAALVNVSPQAIARGRKLLEQAVPELVGAVTRGTVSLSQASRVAKLDSSQQRDLVAKGDQAIVEEAARIQKGNASARPSTTKMLGDLDRLCSELTIQKVAEGEWSVEGRLQASDEAVEERAATLKETLTKAWTQAQGMASTEE